MATQRNSTSENVYRPYIRQYVARGITDSSA